MSSYTCVFSDGDKCRMYYSAAWRMMQKAKPGSSNICAAQSSDGAIWTKPNLRCEWYPSHLTQHNLGQCVCSE